MEGGLNLKTAWSSPNQGKQLHEPRVAQPLPNRKITAALAMLST
ncbi:hypothetical protein J2X57_001592 [Luteibacter sp. 1214]|nr:hypothetical protein [Luteibacter sp. 1214]